MNKSTELELLPPSTAEKLDVHAKLIKTFIRGEEKAKGEFVGYAFLVGCQLVAAKKEIPHGNSNDRDNGFVDWVERKFPDYTYRTAANRMTFAETLMEVLTLEQPKSPLLLGVRKLNKLSRVTILEKVREVMDGKTMMEFMRAGRLLKDPAQPDPAPRKSTSKQERLKALVEQSRRVLKGACDTLETAEKILAHAPLDVLQQSLDASVTFSNAVRERIRALKGTQTA